MRDQNPLLTPKDETSMRERFETAAFNQRFMSSIQRTKPGEFGPVGIAFMSKGCPTMAEFLKKREDGSYAEDTLNAAWWAWQAAEEQYSNHVLVPLDEHDRLVALSETKANADAERILVLTSNLHHSMQNTDEAIEHFENFAGPGARLVSGRISQDDLPPVDRQVWEERARLVRKLLEQPAEEAPHG